MPSLNTSKCVNARRVRAFTLIEILVVMGMLALIGALTVFVSMDTYRGSSFRSDRDLLVALLQHARAESVHNICAVSSCTDGASHGVYIGATSYTIFQGASYAGRVVADDQNFTEDGTVTRAGASEVVFAALSGTVAAQTTITLSGDNKTSVITIEPSGRIWWTN